VGADCQLSAPGARQPHLSGLHRCPSASACLSGQDMTGQPEKRIWHDEDDDIAVRRGPEDAACAPC
jgi:hypothetical protein